MDYTRLAFRRAFGLPAAFPPTEDLRCEDLFAYARRHRLLALLWNHLGDDLRQLLDEPTRSSWQRSVYGRARYTALLRDETARVNQLTATALPQLLLIKGPALEDQAWPETGGRDYDDLDFRCRFVPPAKLLQVMAAAGYAPDGLTPDLLAHRWTFGWGATFRNNDGFMLEINHRLFPPQYPQPHALRVWENTRHLPTFMRVGEFAVPTLSPALHLLLACMHGVWHGWERIAWMVDVGGLLGRHNTIVNDAYELAADSPFARACLTQGVQLAETWLGPGLPIAPLTPLDTAVPTSIGTLLPARELLVRQRSLMGSRERITSQLRHLVTPGDGDFRSLRLPIGLCHAYWFWRPVRLATHFMASRFR